MKKYLRSILCLLLALSVVFCFAACSDKDEDEDDDEEVTAAGNYVFQSMTSEGITVDADGLETALGLSADEVFIILNKDGTGTLCFGDEVEELEWDEEEITDSTGEVFSYTLKDGLLTLESDDMEMTFKKTSKKLTVPEVEAEPEVASTNYTIYAAISEGITLTGADLATTGITTSNSYVTLNDDGTAVFAFMGELENMGWNAAGMWPASDPTDVANMAIDGDVLTISQDGFVMIFVKEGSSQVPELPAATSDSVVGRYELYSLSDGTTTYEGATLLLIVQAMEMETIDDYMYLELFEDGTGKLVPMGIEGPIEYNETHLWPQGETSNTIAYTYENGMLTFELEGNIFVFQKK